MFAIAITRESGEVETVGHFATEDEARQERNRARRRRGVVSVDIFTTEPAQEEVPEDTAEEMAEALADLEELDATEAQEQGEEVTEAQPEEAPVSQLPTIEPGSGMYLDDDGHVWVSFADVARRLGCRYQMVFQRHGQGRLISRRYTSTSVGQHWQARLDSVEEWEVSRNAYLSNRARRQAERQEEVEAEPEELEAIEPEAEVVDEQEQDEE